MTLGSGGTLSVRLVPNAGATPAQMVYTVVYQLSDGEVKTEYWVVPTTSPTTIAAVRTVLGASNSGRKRGDREIYPTSSLQVSSVFFTKAMN